MDGPPHGPADRPLTTAAARAASACVILCALLHHLQDEEDPAGIVAALRAAVPSGSHFFITRFRTEHNEKAQRIEQMLQASFGRGRWREQSEIETLFTGLDLVEPGIVPLVEWHPDAPLDRELTAWDRLIAGGIGRKP